MIFLISGVISHETEILNYVIFFLSKRVDVCAENTGNVLMCHEQNSKQGHNVKLSVKRVRIAGNNRANQN